MRSLFHSALLLVLATPAQAQPLPASGEGFTWERVGDRPLDAADLAFGPDGALWASGDEGPTRLNLSSGFPGAWVLTRDFPVETVLPLGTGGPQGDTLVVGTGASVHRSANGGANFAIVHDEGGDGALYEVPPGHPFAGRVLAGTGETIAYSADRGGSFTASVRPAPDGNRGGGEGVVALPPGTPDAGRILGTGRWGVHVSDDGGATFR